MAERKSRNTATRKTENKGGAKKEFKNQNFKMRGTLNKMDCFGQQGRHVWFSIKEHLTGTGYMFKFFNISDDKYDILADNTEFEVYFNIGYNKQGNNVTMQLVATNIYPIVEE